MDKACKRLQKGKRKSREDTKRGIEPGIRRCLGNKKVHGAVEKAKKQIAKKTSFGKNQTGGKREVCYAQRERAKKERRGGTEKPWETVESGGAFVNVKQLEAHGGRLVQIE